MWVIQFPFDRHSILRKKEKNQNHIYSVSDYNTIAMDVGGSVGRVNIR